MHGHDGGAAVGFFGRLLRITQRMVAHQAYLYERYFDALGTSGHETRAAFEIRARSVDELERSFDAPAIRERRRDPARREPGKVPTEP